MVLSFDSVSEAHTAADVSAWLKALPDNEALAICISDSAMSLACGDAFQSVSLGGDLLSLGMDPAEVLTAVAPAMENRPVILHDGKAMRHLLKKYGLPQPESFDWDVMLGAYLIDPQLKSYTLLSLLEGLPEDARGLLSLAVWQKRKVEADGMLPLMNDIEQPLSRVLYDMEQEGFRVDVDALKALGREWTAQIEQLRSDVFTACRVPPFNLNSTQQLGEVLFDKLGLPHGKKTTKGYSTAVEVLEGLRDIAPEIIEPLLKYRQLVKLQGTYIEGLLRLT